MHAMRALIVKNVQNNNHFKDYLRSNNSLDILDGHQIPQELTYTSIVLYAHYTCESK